MADGRDRRTGAVVANVVQKTPGYHVALADVIILTLRSDEIGATPSDGMTTDGANIWIAGFRDALAYKYDMSGTFLSIFGLHAPNGDASGVTTDGTNMWVVEHKDDEVYKYDMNLVYTNVNFLLDAGNLNAKGTTVTPK